MRAARNPCLIVRHSCTHTGPHKRVSCVALGPTRAFASATDGGTGPRAGAASCTGGGGGGSGALQQRPRNWTSGFGHSSGPFRRLFRRLHKASDYARRGTQTLYKSVTRPDDHRLRQAPPFARSPRPPAGSVIFGTAGLTVPIGFSVCVMWFCAEVQRDPFPRVCPAVPSGRAVALPRAPFPARP